ncbi:MAG: hypothetical protein AMXMBFR58_04220 [Phycisphaerae bacterium]
MPREGMYSPFDNEGASVTLLAHADRCWKAEEVNATRIAARCNLVLSGITAILGLKLFAASKELETIIRTQWWLSALCWIPAVIAMYFLLKALKIVLEVKELWRNDKADPTEIDEAVFGEDAETDPNEKQPSRGMSSRGLQISKKLSETPHRITDTHARWYIFKLVDTAARNLHRRNDERSRAVDEAQAYFFWGCLLLFVSFTVYTLIVVTESPIPGGGTKP